MGTERGCEGKGKGGEEERKERRSGTCKWSGLRDGCGVLCSEGEMEVGRGGVQKCAVKWVQRNEVCAVQGVQQCAVKWVQGNEVGAVQGVWQ